MPDTRHNASDNQSSCLYFSEILADGKTHIRLRDLAAGGGWSHLFLGFSRFPSLINQWFVVKCLMWFMPIGLHCLA